MALAFNEIASCSPPTHDVWGRALFYSASELKPVKTLGGRGRHVAGIGLGEAPPGTAWGSRQSGSRVTLMGIPDGEAGTAATIEKMKEAVFGDEGAHNKDVRLLAQQIVSDVASKDYVGEARAIFEFMRKHVRYTLDPRGLEWVQTPWWTLLVMGQGDCDDHSSAIAALAVALGHGAGFRTVKGDPSRPDEWSHVYAVVGIRQDGQERWLPLDSTEKYARFGEDPPGAESVQKRTWVIVPA